MNSEQLYKEFKQHVADERAHQEVIIKSIQENDRCLKELTNDTKGLVEAWESLDGAIKVFNVIGKAILWTSGVISSVTAILWFSHNNN